MTTPEFSGQSGERFPLNPEQVEQSLSEIREDPSHALTDVEAAYLEFRNPELSFLLVTGLKTLPLQEATAYTEAALTVYKLAREAGTTDGTSPRLSVDGRSSLASNIVVALEASMSVEPSQPVARTIREAFEPELSSEPNISEVVDRLAAHRIDRDAYYAGAATVVAGLRLAMQELQA